MKTHTIRVGMVGCGRISGAYVAGCRAYRAIELIGCADRDASAARLLSSEHGISMAGSVAELIARPDVDMILNLTPPAAHAEVNRLAIAAGKHVYCEKPFALTVADAKGVIEQAAAAKIRVGCAPDTFLGAGIQTARHFLDGNAIGRPVAALGFMMIPGHESWHPNPDFYYKKGGGPMFDMGPYYLTALVNLLGPVSRVSGVATRNFETRTITCEPRRGEVIDVEVPTHYSTTLEFAAGVTATLVMSFDTHRIPLPRIVISGTEGTLAVPDPNSFDGEVQICRPGEKAFSSLPSTHPPGRARGSGVCDLAAAIGSGRQHRANERVALHVLEILEAAGRSHEEQRHVPIESTCERPAAVSPDLPVTEFEP